MNGKDKFLNLLRDNDALARKFEEAMCENASVDSIKALFADAAVDVDEDVLQELLSMIQQDKLSDITEQEMDDEQLSAVAGGGNGLCDNASSCDCNFKEFSTLPRDVRCKFSHLCDECFWKSCRGCYTDIQKDDGGGTSFC